MLEYPRLVEVGELGSSGVILPRVFLIVSLHCPIVIWACGSYRFTCQFLSLSLLDGRVLDVFPLALCLDVFPLASSLIFWPECPDLQAFGLSTESLLEFWKLVWLLGFYSASGLLAFWELVWPLEFWIQVWPLGSRYLGFLRLLILTWPPVELKSSGVVDWDMGPRRGGAFGHCWMVFNSISGR